MEKKNKGVGKMWIKPLNLADNSCFIFLPYKAIHSDLKQENTLN
jgi:hypothetical protein